MRTPRSSSRRPRASTTLSSTAGSLPQTSRSMSEWAESLPSPPWLYPYREYAQSTRLDGPVFRPFVPISLCNEERDTLRLTGLVDTGADSILASDLLAEQLGIDLDDHDGETSHSAADRVARFAVVVVEVDTELFGQQVRGENRVGAGVDEAGEPQGVALLVAERDRHERPEHRAIEAGGLGVLAVWVEPGRRGQRLSPFRHRSARLR